MAPKLSPLKEETNTFLINEFKRRKTPYVNKQTKISFKMAGYREIANALRRTLLEEIEGIKCLALEDLETTEEQIIIYKIRLVIAEIPVKQSIPNDKVFTLSYQNKSPEPQYVYTHDFPELAKYANRIPLFMLQGGKSVRIRIRVKSDVGWRDSHFSVVNRIAFKDNSPVSGNSFTDEPTEFQFVVYTNGTVAPNDLIEMARESLLNRVEALRKQLPNLKFNEKTGEGKLQIMGETNTFKPWFIRNGLLFDTIIGGSNVQSRDRSFILMIRQTSRDSALKILNKVLDEMRKDIRAL